MAQQGVERVGIDKHDYARTGRMALYGGGASHRSFAQSQRKISPKHSKLISHHQLDQPSLAPQLQYGSNSSKKGSDFKMPTLQSLHAYSPTNACLRLPTYLCS